MSFDVFALDADFRAGAQCPPQRFAPRDERLRALAGLWRGDLTEFGIKHLVAVNYFHSYSTKLANLLLISPPQGSVPLDRSAYDALIDLTRYGGAVLRWDGEAVSAMDPMGWYPRRDGGNVFIRAFVSDDSLTATSNRLNVITVEPDSATFSAVYAFSVGKIGKLESVEELPASVVEIVPRSPTMGIWGTAKYIELCDPVVEIARRLSGNRRILDLYAGPKPVFKSADINAEQRYGVDADIDTASQVQRKIMEGQIGEIEEETLHLPDELVDVSYLQPAVEGVAAGLAQIRELRDAIAQLTGLPSLGGEFQAPSGEALKRLFLHFYAESAAMQEALRRAFGVLLGGEVRWDHVFDVFEVEAQKRAGRMGIVEEPGVPAPAPAGE